MGCKKAAGHIETAISFGMFILFVFFLLVYLNPIRSQNISEVLLDTIQVGVEKNASLQLIELPFNLKFPAEICFAITNPFNTTNRNNILVKDVNGNVIKFSLTGEEMWIEKKGDFYYLYFADGTFNTPSLEAIKCTQLNATDYSYAASRTYPLFFMPRMQDIKNMYQNDYDSLREEFNFPLNHDFAVNITDSVTKENILTMTIKKPERVEVYARELPIEILYDDGKIAKATINIHVW